MITSLRGKRGGLLAKQTLLHDINFGISMDTEDRYQHNEGYRQQSHSQHLAKQKKIQCISIKTAVDKETDGDTRSCKDPCSWPAWVNIVKTAILPKAIYTGSTQSSSKSQYNFSQKLQNSATKYVKKHTEDREPTKQT